jgi:hypothetical protein
MEEPGKAELHLSDDLLRSVGGAERARALQSAVNQARVKSNPVDQLDSFCVQMSIRLYWMEKAWQAGVIAPLEQSTEPTTPRAQHDFRHDLLVWWQQWKLPVMLMGAVIAIGGFLRWAQLYRRRYPFPQVDFTPRLGLPHAASTSEIVHFSPRRHSPHARRDP